MTAFVRELPNFGQYGNKPMRANALYMGEPDGPMRFIKSLGMEVPTYVDPREDLKSQYRSAAAHVHIDYHVPVSKRGPYIPSQLADYDPNTGYPLTSTQKVRCGGLKPDGQICQKSAMNRTGFCTNHGGALHPADKLFSSERGIMPTHPSQLNRLQKVEMGIIPVSELSDLEISRQQIQNEDGTFSKKTQALSGRIIGQMRKEFFDRAEQFVRENTMDMLKEMKDIATSKLAEDRDKIQAIQWMTERVLGKTPDVLITNKTDSPFEQMMGDVEGGTREAYRAQKTEQPLHGGVPVIEGEIVEADILAEINALNGEDEDDDEPATDALPQANTAQADDNDPIALAAARKARKDAIRKSRNRKFAAKSRGLDSLDDIPYDLSFKKIQLGGVTVTRMKLISPDDQKSPSLR